ncbi:malto-oligosyltrehalose synthase [Azorhizobium oxalatiphilum]|uniref:Malto-oligosyltrehalose synthase n=1 Tax=Azorhizobium oxalatiphilum TaxID=980631 RepID=A0A917BN24_9HYPH|nr:malto-oligosyltrehalose synthase [Azorhizobium oxalatiphilum]GGF47129.1 malto-oligosyltrehalose synthase [Azorhizobium oxalatiphilum]
MIPPRATVRLQFHKGFTLDDAIPLLDYFSALGISHIYSSPLLTSRVGSGHGYDTVDYTTLDAETGGEEALRRLSVGLKARGMGLILDIVPNHMGVGGADNRVWLDTLEWGRASAHAEVFDVDWTPADPQLTGKLLAPFLDRPYGEALSAGALQLAYDETRGTFHISHHEHIFPICPLNYAELLASAELPELAEARLLFEEIAATPAPHPDRVAGAQTRLSQAVAEAGGATFLQPIIAAFDATTEDGKARLHALLERQNYRLAWWRTANDDLNWRRFFDITGLAGVKVERADVFDQTHALIFRLYTEGLIDGLRIDHVDGIADPGAYCQRLRRQLEALEDQRPEDALPGGYVVVEKILHPGERLPADWPVEGTTGYDFMDEVSAVLHNEAAATALTTIWQETSGERTPYAAQLESARRQILRDGFGAEMKTATRSVHQLALSDLDTRDITEAALRRALNELVVAFPVYRSYVTTAGRTQQDTLFLRRAAENARRRLPPIDHPVLDLLARWVSGITPETTGDVWQTGTRAYALAKFQQLTAPIAAKSMEDTLFYRYGRLISRNEVGSDPIDLAMPVAAFHDHLARRAAALPHAMLATATHDHKRGEDSRMRLAVISELPHIWRDVLDALMGACAPFRAEQDLGPAPGRADEIMLYQTLIGAWPHALDPEDTKGLEELCERVSAWQLKAMREAKGRTNWVFPDEDYESASRAFLETLLKSADGVPARKILSDFVRRIDPAGALNSLAQTALKYTVPGVPDLYQGTEFWDLSLVDPDNRRPVDYEARTTAFATPAATAPAGLLPRWRDGHVKQALIGRLLHARRDVPQLFTSGTYRALEVRGPRQDNALAFAREVEGAQMIVLVSRLAAPLLESSDMPLLPPEVWRDTTLAVPAQFAGTYNDVLTGRTIDISAEGVGVAGLLADLPVAVLLRQGQT